MDTYLLDWANLLLRWAHVITAIAWIGSSFYFVFLDSSLTAPTAPDLKAKGVNILTVAQDDFRKKLAATPFYGDWKAKYGGMDASGRPQPAFADEVTVTLTDKREFKARIVGVDKRSDVAVVKIEAAGLPAIKVGDVSRLKVGEWVMAIGSPFGLDNTVTAGIVSAKQRDTGDYLPFIQTDVAINPGNSGGPLINMRGEVVGINSQIYSRSGGFMGISFAIPIDEAVRVSEQLRATGKVQRGRLGVQIDQVSKEVAESLGLSKTQGALVRGVEQGSPAEKAGLEPGDIILKFEGKTIEKSSDLPRMVGNTKPGTRSAIQVWRRGSLKDMHITVGEFEAEKPVKKASAAEKPQAGNVTKVLGLTVGELTDAQKKELKLRGGVRVDAVAEPASRAGIQEGDVILALANIETPNVQALEALAAKLDRSKPVSLLIRRGEWAQYTVIRPVR